MADILPHFSFKEIAALVTTCLAIVVVFVLPQWSSVSNLARIEQDDPLFDFPGLSKTEMDETVLTVQNANRRIMTALPEDLRTYNLYPVHFWAAVSEVREKRDKFLASPSRMGAKELLDTERAAAEAYQRDLDSFRILLDQSYHDTTRHHALNRETDFFFLPGVTSSIPTLEKALSLMKQNGDVLAKEVERRGRCLRLGRCVFPGKKIVQEAQSENSLTDVASLLLPVSDLTASAAVSHTSPLDQPLYTVATGCFGPTPAVFEMSQRSVLNDSLRIFYPKLVTNEFFRKLNNTHIYPQDRHAREAGFGYVWQPETNWYLCPDTSYIPTLATMYILRDLNKKHPLLSSAPPALSHELKNMLGEREHTFLNADIIDLSIIQRYVDTLELIQKHELHRADAPWYDELHHRVRMWQTKTGNLYPVMNALTWYSTKYTERLKSGTDTSWPVIAPVSHAYIPILFATSNASIWRLGASLDLIQNDAPLRASASIRDIRSLKKTLSEAVIQKLKRISVSE